MSVSDAREVFGALDSIREHLKRLDAFRTLRPEVEIFSPAATGYDAWQAHWSHGSGTLTVTRHTLPDLLDAMRGYFKTWEPDGKASHV